MIYYLVTIYDEEDVELSAAKHEIDDNGRLIFIDDNDNIIAVFKEWTYFYEIDPPDEEVDTE